MISGRAIGMLIMAAMTAGAPCAGGKDGALLKPAKHVGPGLPSHALTNRAFQGISSMAVTPKGRLWAIWYAGRTPGEDHNNYVVLSTSGDQGKTWREALVVDPDRDGPVRAFDPQVWMAPDGKLRLFWAQSVGHDGTVAGVWCLVIRNPESNQPEYDKPVRITNGVMMCKPLVLSSGGWVLPASTWRKTDNSAKFVVSTDRGKTWTVRGGCNVPPRNRAFDEHMFVEREDGTIWLLARTNYGIGESVSTDRGKTWPELKPSKIPHPSARFFITRLNSGNLLLVKHGPMNKRTGRSHLMAFVSTDDGKTWGEGLMLDERNSLNNQVRLLHSQNQKVNTVLTIQAERESFQEIKNHLRNENPVDSTLIQVELAALWLLRILIQLANLFCGRMIATRIGKGTTSIENPFQRPASVNPKVVQKWKAKYT